MTNIITWRHGRPGKGWLHTDDTVSAWSVSSSGVPHHADMPHAAGSLRFLISPDGAVELHAASQSRLPVVEAVLRDALGGVS